MENSCSAEFCSSTCQDLMAVASGEYYSMRPFPAGRSYSSRLEPRNTGNLCQIVNLFQCFNSFQKFLY